VIPTVLAHGISQKADIPISETLALVTAAIVLVVSFVILALFWPKPKLEGDSWRPIGKGDARGAQPAFWQVIDVFCGVVGLLLLFVVIWAGFSGVQTVSANITPTFVYVIFWNGLVLLSLLFGDVFRAFNPWRAAAKPVAWVAEKAAGSPMPAPLKYPERLGYWPAVAGIFAFSVLELVVEDGDLPRNIAIATVVYSAATWIGMALYGIDRWLDRGEGFSVYFNLFARMSVWERRDGILGIRKPLSGLTRFEPLTGSVAFLAVLIGSVSFDGFSEGPAFTDIRPDIASFFTDIGFSRTGALEMAQLVGLVAAVGIVFGFYVVGVWGARTVGPRFEPKKLARAFVHTLVPIALVYVAAHYMTQLLFQGQAMAFLASDPLGEGWDLFGGAGAGIDYGVIGATATWYWQVGFVLAGHIAGLALAHDRALVLYKDAKDAVQSQYYLLGVMVGFTCLALWLLSKANA
jgi:hypothetical protein